MRTFKKPKNSQSIKLTSKINKKMYAELSYEANTLHNIQFEHRFSKVESIQLEYRIRFSKNYNYKEQNED